MLSEPIITIDVHGMNVEKALDAIHKKVDGAGSVVYVIRVIHGFHGGTRICSAVREEFGYGLHPYSLREYGHMIHSSHEREICSCGLIFLQGGELKDGARLTI